MGNDIHVSAAFSCNGLRGRAEWQWLVVWSVGKGVLRTMHCECAVHMIHGQNNYKISMLHMQKNIFIKLTQNHAFSRGAVFSIYMEPAELKNVKPEN